MAVKATEMHEDAAPDSRKPVAPAILSPVFLSNPTRFVGGAQLVGWARYLVTSPKAIREPVPPPPW